MSDLAGLPILELPQFDEVTKEPIMVINEETGEEEQLILHSISYPGGGNASSAAVEITEEMIKTPVQLAREVDWSQLVAL